MNSKNEYRFVCLYGIYCDKEERTWKETDQCNWRKATVFTDRNSYRFKLEGNCHNIVLFKKHRLYIHQITDKTLSLTVKDARRYTLNKVSGYSLPTYKGIVNGHEIKVQIKKQVARLFHKPIN